VADNVAITAGSGTTVGTDERTIASTAVHVQRVIDEGGTTFANGQVEISSTAANIVAARETRKAVTVINRQTVPVWVGVATVTTANGIRLDPGEAHTFETTAAVQGITSAVYTASGDAKVHYEEDYDS